MTPKWSSLQGAVDEVLARRGNPPGSRVLQLAWAVDGWMAFSRLVAAGFWGGIDDYLVELYRRDMLDEVVGIAPVGDDRSALIADLSTGDETFRQATTDVRPGWALETYFRVPPSGGWWWHRTPTRLGDLADYFPDATDDTGE